MIRVVVHPDTVTGFRHSSTSQVGTRTTVISHESPLARDEKRAASRSARDRWEIVQNPRPVMTTILSEQESSVYKDNQSSSWTCSDVFENHDVCTAKLVGTRTSFHHTDRVATNMFVHFISR